MIDRGQGAGPTVESGSTRERLARASLSLGLTPSEVELDRLLAYLGLLQRWNAVYNLTALRDPDAMLSHHVVDCLAILPALRRAGSDRRDGRSDRPGEALTNAPGGGDQALRLLDVGSGAGLPGVVVAIMEPAWQVVCVDAVGKKASFVRQVGAELGLGNLTAAQARVESMKVELKFDLITSRAFASLADFVTPTDHLLAADGAWAAMKGSPSAQEVAALPPQVEMFHVEQLLVPGLDARRCLVWMRRRSAG